MVNNIEKGIFRLICTNPYYGEMIHRMKRICSTEVPTMGVVYDQIGITFFYNPYFTDSLTTDEVAGVIEHECAHILGEHYERELILEPEYDRKKALKEDAVKTIEIMLAANLLNICEDVAINQWINRIPKTFKAFDKEGNIIVDDRKQIIDETSFKKYINAGNKINDQSELEKFMIDNPNYGQPIECEPATYTSFKKLVKDKVEVKEKMPFEYYYNLLLKETGTIANQVAAGLKKMIVTIDNHQQKDNEINKETRKELARQLANEAKKAFEGKKQVGTLSSYIEEALSALNNKPKNWKRDIKKFVAKNISAYQEVTRHRRNKRQRINEPLIEGFRNKQKLKLVWAIDTSGSMDTTILQQIASEGKKLHDDGVQLILIECDANIQNVKEYKGENNLKVNGRGGTAFNPVFKYVDSPIFNKKFGNIDGLIFFTDGMCSENSNDLIKPKYPILWAMNEGYKKPTTWGWETEIKVIKK